MRIQLSDKLYLKFTATEDKELWFAGIFAAARLNPVGLRRVQYSDPCYLLMLNDLIIMGPMTIKNADGLSI